MNKEQLRKEKSEGRGERRQFFRSGKGAFLMLLCLFLLSLSACQAVKPYQRMYLNDKDMALKLRQIEGYESNIHAYREGAAGANGGKAGGGCGCN